MGDRYLAFISYSRVDSRWATALHERLERYRVPRPLRARAGLPRGGRVRPVFLDTSELAAASSLDGALREAIDRSRRFVFLASRASATSPFVRDEIQHLLDSGRASDFLMAVLDGEPGERLRPGVVPPFAQDLASGTIWVDGRGTDIPTQEAVLRLAAGILGVGYDELHQRDRRRRLRTIAGWIAFAVALGAVVGGILWQQHLQREALEPLAQEAAFVEYREARIREEIDGDPVLGTGNMVVVQRAEDLNGDGLLDFFARDSEPGVCGSAGCPMGLYMTRSLGDSYESVLSLYGLGGVPQTREEEGHEFKAVLGEDFVVDGAPIYSVYRWDGEAYALSEYEFHCAGTATEFCGPSGNRILPADEHAVAISAGVPLRVAPHAEAQPIWQSLSEYDPDEMRIVGHVEGTTWYLVQSWKTFCGFVDAADRAS